MHNNTGYKYQSYNLLQKKGIEDLKWHKIWKNKFEKITVKDLFFHRRGVENAK